MSFSCLPVATLPERAPRTKGVGTGNVFVKMPKGQVAQFTWDFPSCLPAAQLSSSPFLTLSDFLGPQDIQKLPQGRLQAWWEKAPPLPRDDPQLT